MALTGPDSKRAVAFGADGTAGVFTAGGPDALDAKDRGVMQSGVLHQKTGVVCPQPDANNGFPPGPTVVEDTLPNARATRFKVRGWSRRGPVWRGPARTLGRRSGGSLRVTTGKLSPGRGGFAGLRVGISRNAYVSHETWVRRLLFPFPGWGPLRVACPAYPRCSMTPTPKPGEPASSPSRAVPGRWSTAASFRRPTAGRRRHGQADGSPPGSSRCPMGAATTPNDFRGSSTGNRRPTTGSTPTLPGRGCDCTICGTPERAWHCRRASIPRSGKSDWGTRPSPSQWTLLVRHARHAEADRCSRWLCV
jgi:hypothetical protein